MLLLPGCPAHDPNPPTPAALTSITVTPANTSIAPGTTIQFTATGTYSNNSHRIITTSVTWDSSDTTIASISNTQGSQGVATATMNIGSTNITASLSGISGVTSLSTSTVASIVVLPATASVAPRTTQQFYATGALESGDHQDLTTWAAWVSSNTSIANINAAGLASAGTVSDSATITASYSAITGTGTLIVSPVAGISLTPTAAKIAKGTTQQFAATGTLFNNATQTLTSWATWASSSTPVATISNAAGSQGMATAVSEGISSITAAFDSQTFSAATLTVTAAVITSITVTPASADIVIGQTKQFTARGAFSDASTQDISSSVTWHSSNTAVATIDTSGVAHSAGIGTTSITATASGITSNTATLTVADAALTSIIVTSQTSSIVQGQTLNFNAVGVYTDGISRDITTFVTWNSSNENVAAISNITGFQGVATASTANVGTTSITASLSGITSNSVTLTVTYY